MKAKGLMYNNNIRLFIPTKCAYTRISTKINQGITSVTQLTMAPRASGN